MQQSDTFAAVVGCWLRQKLQMPFAMCSKFDFRWVCLRLSCIQRCSGCFWCVRDNDTKADISSLCSLMAPFVDSLIMNNHQKYSWKCKEVRCLLVNKLANRTQQTIAICSQSSQRTVFLFVQVKESARKHQYKLNHLIYNKALRQWQFDSSNNEQNSEFSIQLLLSMLKRKCLCVFVVDWTRLAYTCRYCARTKL